MQRSCLVTLYSNESVFRHWTQNGPFSSLQFSKIKGFKPVWNSGASICLNFRNSDFQNLNHVVAKRLLLSQSPLTRLEPNGSWNSFDMKFNGLTFGFLCSRGNFTLACGRHGRFPFLSCSDQCPKKSSVTLLGIGFWETRQGFRRCSCTVESTNSEHCNFSFPRPSNTAVTIDWTGAKHRRLAIDHWHRPSDHFRDSCFVSDF